MLLLCSASLFVAGACDGGGGDDPDTLDLTTDIERDELAESVEADSGCPLELSVCDGVCTSLQRDTANCGACGHECLLGESCVEGSCAILCPAAQVVCGGHCVDPTSDREHCGAGLDCEAEPGTVCGDGEVCADGACSLSCQPGLIECAGVCINPNTNRQHCGGCDDGSGGRVCPAGSICAGGSCRLSCLDGWTNCEGECVDLLTDKRYCSGIPDVCGTGCLGEDVCSGGSCGPFCSGSTTLCGNSCTSTQRDPRNCGGCGGVPEEGDHVCVQTLDSFSYCESGSCHVVACPDGWGNCDANHATGCETNLGTAENCGACGLVVDTMVDEANCGACGTPCASDQFCVDGECRNPGDEVVFEYRHLSTTITLHGVVIPPGSFIMGSPEDEPYRSPTEEGQHEVVITRPFVMAQTELTLGQWPGLPSFDCFTPDCPLQRLSKNTSMNILDMMSGQSGLTPCHTSSGTALGPACDGYRLPTEAEWEYAYRAGTTSALYNGDIESGPCPNNLDDIAWSDCNSTGGVHRVKQLAPNAWNLYDMSGNASEWVWDGFNPYDLGPGTTNEDPFLPFGPQMTRGGSVEDRIKRCRAAARTLPLSNSPTGIRWVRTLL